MPHTDILVLGYVVAFFSAFIVAIGGVATWQVLSDLKDRRATHAAPAPAAVSPKLSVCVRPLETSGLFGRQQQRRLVLVLLDHLVVGRAK